MKMKNTKTRMFLNLILIIVLCIFETAMVYAASNSKVMQALITGDTAVKAYVKNASAEKASYQIGNIAADAPKGYPIAEDSNAMRTLIMIDNSLSIPKSSRPLMKEMVKAILDSHGEKETFRIATFSDKITYLSDQYYTDYTILKNLVDSIEFVDQETYLTDVLYDVIDELKNENYEGYTRIIIFSDGVDNKPLTVTRDALNQKLQESPFPVYTIGSKTGKNDSELSNMFALSRLMDCEYFILEENDASALTAITSQDTKLTVFETDIPEDAKTGGRHSSKLTLSDGTELVFDVDMPFSIKQKETEAPEIKGTIAETPEVEEEENVESPAFPIWLIVALFVGLLLIAIIIVIIALMLKKKKSRPAPVPQNPRPVTSDYQQTQFINDTPNHMDNGTLIVTPDGQMCQVDRYRFILTDAADSSRSFRCELVDKISIGRQPDNNIVISDDTTVHGRQSIVSIENSVVKYEDLKQVHNRSAINGVLLTPGIPKLIVSNSKITIGRHTYVVSVEKQ